jgi:hypothetical protein
MSGEISYNTHILIGVRPNGVMTAIADSPHLPKQADVQHEIDGAGNGYVRSCCARRRQLCRRVAMGTVPRSINPADLAAVPEFGVAFWRGAFPGRVRCFRGGEAQFDYLRFVLIAILCKPKYSELSHG